MRFRKKTKILATLGPATNEKEILTNLVQSGVNAVRLNFSHSSKEEHKNRLSLIREIAQELSVPLAVIADVQGRKIRLGELARPISLEENQTVTLFYGETSGDQNLPVQTNIFGDLSVNNVLLVNDGAVKLEVRQVHQNHAECRVIIGGTLSSHKGINLPDVTLSGTALTQKDKDDLAYILPLGVEYVAVSFVQNKQDIQSTKDYIASLGFQTKIIAKIECIAAIRNLEEIVQISDMVMIARGDMAVEAGQEEVPIIQQRITQLARSFNTPVIVATQMLESMISSQTPTRAEVNDVASAVFDQVDMVMLSAETAIGKYPAQVVSIMDKIIERVGRFLESQPLPLPERISHTTDQTKAIATASVVLAKELSARCVITLTESGKTAREVAFHRPPIPIIAITDDVTTYNELSVFWGLTPYFFKTIPSTEEVFTIVKEWLLKETNFRENDHLVAITGIKHKNAAKTNTITVVTV